MASSKELGAESVTGYDDEDIRGDSKKRKFKPLSAMKRFFTKRRDKKDAVVAVKAKSTTALHSGYRTEDDEDDDDGGFKSHTKPLSLAGNRSLSEDSVFSSEPRVQPVSAFPKSAVSEESLPKSAFQSELLSKLNQRRYQTSDDDVGLPRSPVPPVMTTADVILGEPLKKPPGKSDKTSNNRDSDQSLISVDSSENEEEDKWRSSVPARKLGQTASPTSGSAMDSFDLNSIQKTELLVSRAAKDRILVKPKRKGTRQSHKKRDSSTPTPPLPSLNEESPTGTRPENVKGNRISGSPTAVSPVKRTFSDETPSSPSSATSFPPVPASDSKPGPSVSSRSKPALSSIVATSSKEGDRESPQTSPTSKSPQITASVAAVAASPPPPPPKVTTPTSPGAAFPPHKVDGISNTISQSQPASSHPAIVDILGKPADVKKFEENLSASDRGDRLNLHLATDISVSRLSQSHRGLNEIRPNSDFRSVISQFQNPGLASSRNSGVIASSIDDSPLKVSDSSSTVLDFKARREVRSRTLPAVSSEQSVPTVQRSSSHHVPVSGNSSKEPEQQPSSYKNAASTSAAAVTLPSASGTSKPESDKLSSEDSSVTPTDELPFSFVVQKKENCHEVNLENEVTKVSEVVQKSEVSVSESKSTSTSNSRIEKKRGSVETVSYKNKDLYDQTFKKAENSDVKRRSADINNATKLGSIDVSSTQRESIEIEISQLTSVRASRSLFDSASKMASSQKDIHHPPASAIPSAADRIKPFSASTSSVKLVSNAGPVSNAGQNQTGGAASSYENAKQVATSGGITHHRGGSVKSSPAKPVEARSTFLTRGGSVKGPAESSQSPEPAATTLPSVAETTPAPKHESSGTSSALPSSAAASQTSSAPHAPTHVTAQPNTSLPSQTPSVTPLSFNVKPIYAYASKPATNTASAPRPAAAYIPSGSKPTTATTTTANTSLASNAVDVKLAMGPTSSKSVAVSNVKPVALASVASNVSTPFVSSVVSMPSLLSSSSSSSSVITPVNTTTSSSSSASRSSTLRSHASFTTPAAFKPHITSSAPHSTRSSPVTKSPSFKAAATSTEKPTATEKRATEGKTSTSSATVPAWRTHLSTKEVKIEIIENTPSPQSSSSSSSQNRSEVLRNSSDKGKLSSSVKKTDALTSTGATVETEKTTRRTSKVLDMVKNFQNLQAPS